MKASQEALFWMSREYRRLSDEQRPAVDAEITAWLLSDDAGLRFDALVLIYEHRIVSALPELRLLATRLEHGRDPGDPFALVKVQRAIDRLTDSLTERP